MNQRSTFGLKRWTTKPDTTARLTWADPRFDVATAIHTGARQYQQDALITQFHSGADTGMAVLADGMGGHLGGDVASALAVSSAFSEITTHLTAAQRNRSGVAPLLRRAADRANTAISSEMATNPEVKGMGATLVACVTLGPDLYWVSVGDSPLYLHRDGKLTRLNEDHSMGPQIDAMVASGLLDDNLATDHPQRNQLTSAICGDAIPHVDCPADPFRLQTGDTLILSSDGLQTLSDAAICDIVSNKRKRRADEMTQSLMQAVLDRADAQQDNISVIAIKVLSDTALPALPADTASTDRLTAGAQDGTGIEKASDLLNQALRL